MDFEFDPCSVCNSADGLYCCKICNLKYCCDHLCLHLNVAWETNTWTSRNTQESSYGNNAELATPEVSRFLRHNTDQGILTESPNAKTLLSYTQEELEAQLVFYNAQARRIRRELERRSLPFERLEKGQNDRSFSGRKRSPKRANYKSNLSSKKFTAATDILSNSLREGKITLEFLAAALKFEMPPERL